MSTVISKVYQALLSPEAPSLDVQRRVLTYGTRAKDVELLSQLATHKDLAPEIDLALRDIDLAGVKAAWATRPGRSFEDLAALVDSEKRVKVLTALAERTDLPVGLYQTIANRSKGQTPLFALAANVEVPVEIRYAAAQRLALMLPKSSDSSRANANLTNQLTQLLAVAPDLAEIVARHTVNITAMSAAAAASGLSPEAQQNLAKLCREAYDAQAVPTESLQRYYSFYDYNWLTNIADSLAQMGEVDQDVADRLISMLDELEVKQQAHNAAHNRSSGNTFPEAAKQLREGVKKVRVDLLDLASKASTPNEVTRVLAELTKLRTRSGGWASSSSSDTAAIALAANPNVTLEQVQEIVSNHISWYGRASLLRVVSDPAKVAVIATEMYYSDLDALLEHSSDPALSFSLLLDLLQTRNAHVPDDVLSSKHMNTTLAEKLSLGTLDRENIPPHISEHISGILVERLESDEHWTTFETLGLEFEGSIRDLVQMVRSI